jgi:sugar/nucleoside kinase (ribokinase family)
MGNGSAKGFIVVSGHLCLDIIPAFPYSENPHEYFRPGRLSVVGQPVVSTGGAVSNVGISLHRLGIPARLLARVGNDSFGRLVLEHIGRQGEELSRWISQVEGETSSYTVVLSPPGVDRIFLHCPGSNDTFTERDVSDAALQGARIFHFGYPPLMKGIYSDGGRGLGGLFRRAKARGALTSLDLSLPDPDSDSGRVDWEAFLAQVLPQVDIFVPSIEELAFMLDRPLFQRLSSRGGADPIGGGVLLGEVAELARRALDFGVRVVLIKLGARGAYLRTGSGGLRDGGGWMDRELYAPAFAVDRPAGTTGAGDAAIAGFLASIFKGIPADRALTMAVAVGGCCVEAPDATSGVGTWEETLARVQGGWRRVPADVTETGWRRDRDGTWAGPGDKGEPGCY